MDWAKGYTASYRLVRVDARTWGDAEVVRGVLSASVKKNCSNSTPLLESGAVELEADEFSSGYYRIEMMATQGPEIVCEEIATLWLDPVRTRSGADGTVFECDGFSVLTPASKRYLRRGAFCPAGSDGAEYARELLAECLDAPVSAVGSFRLASDYVFDISSSYLQAVWTILRAGGFRLSISGAGEVTVSAVPDESVRLDRSTVVGEIEESTNVADVPNAYYAMDGDEIEVAYDDDEGSATSTVNRYESDVVDTSPNMLEGESLYSYAQRKLAEARDLSVSCAYVREYDPEISLYTITDDGGARRRVYAQDMELGKGIAVSEAAYRLE